MKSSEKLYPASEKLRNSYPEFEKSFVEEYQQQKIDKANFQKFAEEWRLVEKGSRIENSQISIIKEEVAKVLLEPKDLNACCSLLSKRLAVQLGLERWNVILVNGEFSRKTFASGGHFAIFEKQDKTQVIIWLNKLTHEDIMEKNTLY
jgi:hypothetical protein